jgi:hypothetical protein
MKSGGKPLTGNHNEEENDCFENTQRLRGCVGKCMRRMIRYSTFMSHTPNLGVIPWRRVTNTMTEGKVM